MTKIIAVDFDGTLCENKWPEIGEQNIELFNYLIESKRDGCKLILWTCRCGELLDNAVKWCAEHELIFDAINENLPEIVALFGSDTRKIFANEYIDDRNVIFGNLTAHEDIPSWIYRDFSPYDFKSVEKALGFPLFSWQKHYILYGSFRAYGKTTAEILRALLSKDDSPIDCFTPPCNFRNQFFRDNLLEIKEKLNKAGISTRKVRIKIKGEIKDI